jgi:hypothetical protein
VITVLGCSVTKERSISQFLSNQKGKQMRLQQSGFALAILLAICCARSTAFGQEALEPVPIDENTEIISDECDCGCGDVDSGELIAIAIEDPFNANRLLTFAMDYPESFSASDVFAAIAIAAKSKLQDCIDNVNKKCPEPTKKEDESDAEFQKRLNAWRSEWRRQAEACMKRNQPDDPFKPKKGSNQNKAPWVDENGREWEPHADDKHKPHWDVTPALPKPPGTKGDSWTDEFGNTYTDKGTHTVVYPPWGK